MKCCRKEKDDKEGLMNEQQHSAVSRDHMVSGNKIMLNINIIMRYFSVILVNKFIILTYRKSYPENIYQIYLLSIIITLTEE